MTLVELSEKIRDHLIKQSAQARGGVGGACRYRGDNAGTSCAVGCLIKDEHYNWTLEGKSVREPEVQLALSKSGIQIITHDKTFEMLQKWQRYHDNEYGFWVLGSENYPSPESKHQQIIELV